MRMRWLFGAIALSTLIVSAGCGSSDQPAPASAPAPAVQPASASAISGYDITTVSDGGSISGAIIVSGPVPKLPGRPVNKDPKVCGTVARDAQNLIVGPNGGLRNAVVIVEDVKRGKALPASFQNPQIDQKNCEY